MLRELAAVPPEERLDISGVDPRVVALTQSVSISVHQGRLDQADAHTRAAMRIAAGARPPADAVWACRWQRWMAFRHGDLDESIRLSRATAGAGRAAGLRGAARLGADAARPRHGRGGPGATRACNCCRRAMRCGRPTAAQTGVTELAAIAADALLEAGRMDEAELFVRCRREGAGRRFPSASSPPSWRGCAHACRGRQATSLPPRRAARGARDRLAPGRAAVRAARRDRPGADCCTSKAARRRPMPCCSSALDALPEGHDQPDALACEGHAAGAQALATSDA